MTVLGHMLLRLPLFPLYVVVRPTLLPCSTTYALIRMPVSLRGVLAVRKVPLEVRSASIASPATTCKASSVRSAPRAARNATPSSSVATARRKRNYGLSTILMATPTVTKTALVRSPRSGMRRAVSATGPNFHEAPMGVSPARLSRYPMA